MTLPSKPSYNIMEAQNLPLVPPSPFEILLKKANLFLDLAPVNFGDPQLSEFRYFDKQRINVFPNTFTPLPLRLLPLRPLPLQLQQALPLQPPNPFIRTLKKFCFSNVTSFLIILLIYLVWNFLILNIFEFFFFFFKCFETLFKKNIFISKKYFFESLYQNNTFLFFSTYGKS